jgi:large subunit ribosomal protein L24
MKKEFSKSWISSKRPGKQRKYRYNANNKIKLRMMSAHLSKELKQKYKKRSLSLRKGDLVKIMRGEFKAKEGKITMMDLKNMKITIDGVQFQKKDGTKLNAKIDPSKVIIKEIYGDDKLRIKERSKEKK